MQVFEFRKTCVGTLNFLRPFCRQKTVPMLYPSSSAQAERTFDATLGTVFL